MSCAGMTRGDFFSRTSNLIHLYNGRDDVYDFQDRYAPFQTEEIARLIEEQVQSGARSFLWIVSVTLVHDFLGHVIHFTGEYRGKDGNYVPVIEGTVYGDGMDDGVWPVTSVAGVVPLSSWKPGREEASNPEDFFIRLSYRHGLGGSALNLTSQAIFGGFYEEPYREVL